MKLKHIVRYRFALDVVEGEIGYDPSIPGSYMEAITQIAAIKTKITDAGVHVAKEVIIPVAKKNGDGPQ